MKKSTILGLEKMGCRWTLGVLLRHKLILFFCASFTGMLFAFALMKYEESYHAELVFTHFTPSEPSSNFEKLYEKWLFDLGYNRKSLQVAKKKKHALMEDAFLREYVSVLCVILTKDVKRARAIKRTWVQHCNDVVFYGNYQDEVIPVSRLPNVEPWPLLCGGLLRAWVNFREKLQWMIVVDDRSYVVVENLRYMVAPLVNSSSIFYLGHAVKDIDSDYVYNLGTAGYALNRKALAVLVENVPDDDACDIFSAHCASEDCTLGKLMHQFGASPIDTRDQLGRARFNAFSINELLLAKSNAKYYNYMRNSLYMSNKGEECCSDYAVTFHDVSPNKMYLLEYTVYHLRPFAHEDFQLKSKNNTRFDKNTYAIAEKLKSPKEVGKLSSQNNFSIDGAKVKSTNIIGQKQMQSRIPDTRVNEVFNDIT